MNQDRGHHYKTLTKAENIIYTAIMYGYGAPEHPTTVGNQTVVW